MQQTIVTLQSKYTLYAHSGGQAYLKVTSDFLSEFCTGASAIIYIKEINSRKTLWYSVGHNVLNYALMSATPIKHIFTHFFIYLCGHDYSDARTLISHKYTQNGTLIFDP